MPRPRKSLDQITHRFDFRIELDHESLLPFPNVNGSCGVHKAEARRTVHALGYPIEANRPKSSVNFHGDELTEHDRGTSIYDLNSSEVELLPRPEGFAGNGECMQSSTDLHAGKILRKAVGHGFNRPVDHRQESRAGRRRQRRPLEAFFSSSLVRNSLNMRWSLRLSPLPIFPFAPPPVDTATVHVVKPANMFRTADRLPPTEPMHFAPGLLRID